MVSIPGTDKSMNEGHVTQTENQTTETDHRPDKETNEISSKSTSQEMDGANISDSAQAQEVRTAYLPDQSAPEVTDKLQHVDLRRTSEVIEKIEAPSESKPELYTAFSKRERRLIIFLAAYGGFISPISASIYFPALNDLANHYSVSASAINLTMTTYMIFQGLTPIFVDTFATTHGYRPASIFCFVVYFIANIALATQNSYGALLGLRCLQSFGASGTIALRNGQIASVVTAAERGTIMGFISATMLWGPALAPSIGGALAQYLGWRWIFWLLSILSGTCLVPYVLFMPETNRRLVGDGSVPPSKWWEKSLMDVWRHHKQEQKELSPEAQKIADSLPPRQKLGWPNPLPSLLMIFEKDTAIVLFFGALLYSALYMIMTSVPSIYARVYGFNTIQVSLCYIPLGAGAAFSALANGKLLDHNWRRTAHAHNLPYSRKHTQDLRHFPIEAARLRVIAPQLAISVACILVYGWLLDISCPLAGPLVVSFIGGVGTVAAFSSLGNLLIDMYPGRPSTITATQNVTRCLMGAGATAVVQPMLEGLGPGWCYTIVAGVLVVCSPLLWVERRWGPVWREERYVRLEAKEGTGRKGEV